MNVTGMLKETIHSTKMSFVITQSVYQPGKDVNKTACKQYVT